MALLQVSKVPYCDITAHAAIRTSKSFFVVIEFP